MAAVNIMYNNKYINNDNNININIILINNNGNINNKWPIMY